MKKIIILLLINIFILPFAISNAANCKVSPDELDDTNVGSALQSCLDGGDLVGTDGNGASGDFGESIKGWTNNIAVILSVLAVGSIVYGSIIMVVSAGEEEKIKKAKDIVKWGILGFLGIVSASYIIQLVVNIMYSIE